MAKRKKERKKKQKKKGESARMKKKKNIDKRLGKVFKWCEDLTILQGNLSNSWF